MILRRLLFATRLSLTPRGLYAGSRIAHSKLSTAAIGKIPSKPIDHQSFGLIKVVSVSAPFIYIGSFIAASFAAYLEDLDLFVPDDDDD